MFAKEGEREGAAPKLHQLERDRERERERERETDRQTDRQTQNPKQAPGPELELTNHEIMT